MKKKVTVCLLILAMLVPIAKVVAQQVTGCQGTNSDGCSVSVYYEYSLLGGATYKDVNCGTYSYTQKWDGNQTDSVCRDTFPI